MKTDPNWTISEISPSQIEAIIREARAERAEAMRQTAIELPGRLKRWLANFRPIRERAPRRGAWA